MDTQKALPPWVMPVVAAVGLLFVTLLIWNALFGFAHPVGQDIQVRPGMYDLRAEMQKPRDPNRQRLKDNPPSTGRAVQ